MADKELSGRSLDAAVAEKVMQRKVSWSAAIYGDWMDRSSGRDDVHVARYSSSVEAAMQVEDRIAERGLQNDYIAHLWSVVGATRNGINFWTADNFKAFWLCVHATAEQRCRAALAAIESSKTSVRRTTRKSFFLNCGSLAYPRRKQRCAFILCANGASIFVGQSRKLLWSIKGESFIDKRATQALQDSSGIASNSHRRLH